MRHAVVVSLFLIAAANAAAACEVQPASRFVSRSYAGGTSALSVTAACEWSVSLNASWVRVTGPTTFNGSGTVTFQFDPLPFEATDTSANGRSTTATVGDKTMTIYQSGWSTVGTDVNRDGKADLIWRNKFNGLTWYQPMNGLTPGPGVTLAEASAPAFPGPDWRITTTRTATFGWEIYWRNFSAFQTRRQSMNGTAQFGAQFTFPPYSDHDQASSRFLGAGQFTRGLTEALRWKDVVTLTEVFTGPTRQIWYEYYGWRVPGVDDFDGDQLLDVLWHLPRISPFASHNDGTVFLMLEPGANRQSAVVHQERSADWLIAAAGDLTGDAKADIIWRNSADGRVWVQVMDGFRIVTSAVIWRDADPDWQIQGLADFNGDGRKDILWRNQATGIVFGMLIGENLTILSSRVVHHEPGRSWSLVAPTTPEASARGNVVPGCGYNAKLTTPEQVQSFSTNNSATVSTTAVPQPALVDWTLQNGTITSESNTSMQFTAPRSGTVTLTVTLGDGQTCTDTLTRQIPVVYPCTVTPKSERVGIAYAGGRSTLEVEAPAGCTWTAALPPNSPSWLRIIGPTSFTGNGTVTFEADALPLNNTAESTSGRSATIWIADKDLMLWQSGWEAVGTDFNRDGKADIIWRNKANGTTWALPMNGLTRGTGVTVTAASTPNFNAEWRLVATRNQGTTWQLYWRNVVLHPDEAWMQTLSGTTQVGSPQRLTQLPRSTWVNYEPRILGAGGFRRGNAGGILVYHDHNIHFEHCGPVDNCSFLGQLYGGEPVNTWKFVSTDDFNGDLQQDMLWHNQSTGRVFVTFLPYNSPYQGVTITTRADVNWQVAATGDVNGDAKADIVWRNVATGAMEIEAIDGGRVIGGGPLPAEPDLNWRVQGMADFNGDGTKDLLWRRATTGVVRAQLLKRDFTVLSSGTVYNEPDLNWQIASPTTSERTQAGNVNP